MSNINIMSHHCSGNLSPGLSHRCWKYFVINRRFHSIKMNNINVSFCGHFETTSVSSNWKLRNRRKFSTRCALDDTISPDDSEDGATNDDKESESAKAKANSEEDSNYSQVCI